MRFSTFGAGLALALTALHCPLQGQTWRGEPASLLLFPEYDNSPGSLTFLTVTNTNSDFASGSVVTEWIYISSDCLEFNRQELLTAGDTLTVQTNVHDPKATRGYVVVVAKDPSTGDALPFDWLIGTSSVVDGLGAGAYTVDPFAFKAVGGDVNGDNQYRFDGVEYQASPDALLIPRFLGQDAAANVTSSVVLIDMTGGRDHVAITNLLLHNDNEQVFSAQYAFTCWTKVDLLDVSGAFGNAFLKTTDHDPFEVVGDPQLESGWLIIDGNSTLPPVGPVIPDPVVLGLVVDHAPLDAAIQPFFRGTQTNGGAPPQSFLDCNANGVPDAQDIANGTSGDCNGNDVPDECDPDADGDGFPDDCQPICSPGVTLSLWPPNHGYHALDLDTLAGVVDPLGGALTIVVTAITQDEPINGNGDGNTVCDGTGVGGSVAQVRAERQGGGNGRVYEVHYTATNGIGAACDGWITVTVPHSQNGDPAVDDGQVHDSSEGCP